LEDLAFSSTIALFPFVASSDELETENQKLVQESPKQKKMNNNEEIPEEDTEKYYIHVVKDTDTLVGISLKYKCPVDVIKRTNKLTFDEMLWVKKKIYIPKGDRNKGIMIIEEKESEALKRSRLRSQFAKETECKEKIEMDIYLEDNEWDVKSAVEAYKNDRRWEVDNQMNSTQKSKTDHRKKERQYEDSMLSKLIPNWKS